MHPEQIKAQIRMRGTTPAAIADEFDITPQAISCVIRGVSTSERVQDRIAELIGKPVDQIWKPKKSLKRKLKSRGAV